MLILDSEQVHKALPMPELIEEMKNAYAALSDNRAIVPLRSRLTIEKEDATALFMPAYVPGDAEDSLAVKIVTLFPNNLAKGLPFIHAAVLVMDAVNGKILALLEGSNLTALRTGAGAGAATDLLARAECKKLAIIGSGVQARTQLEAVLAVRDIKEIRVFSPNQANVLNFVRKMQVERSVEILPASTVKEAVAEADIICAATTASAPVFEDADLKPGVHINGVGSYTPEMIEIPTETLARSYITVDSKSACLAEAGEIIKALDQNLIHEKQIVEIGAVANGKKPGRTSPDQITYFKSVGVAVQDAAAAKLALVNAVESGIGTVINW